MEEPGTEQIVRPALNKAQDVRRTKMSYPELTTRGIARKVGCSPQYATRVLKRFLTHSEEELRELQENTADIYDSVKFDILESVTPAKIAKVQVRDAVVAVGILHDKAALIRGQATQIVGVQMLIKIARELRDEEQ